MTQGILAILDSRSFGSIWFWLLLTLCWTLAGRRVLGVPFEVVAAARRIPKQGADDPTALLLLDWLSLGLPRWQLPKAEGTVLLGVAAFGQSALFLLGFVYGLEMAQALVLLTLPFILLYPVELRLARRVGAIVAAAETGALPINDAARQAAGLMRAHRRIITVLSIIAVALTAYRGAIWLIQHPFGF
ncbi:hypothetical protein ACHFJ0_10905 [Paracoccus sp. NGMCC 1.201697]|uniref:Uncharacterized protein n=1 Tax=Paracoccus broussonetiae subsp. drimophilus TaxID=3373869 RepID=A0ABW7LM38_9RHOB